jgi:hypothetical protein
MTQPTRLTRLTGHDAIDYADANGLTLCKYNDPIEGWREDMTPAEAREVAAEDPALVYLDVPDTRAVYAIYNAHSGADMWIGLATDEQDALRQLDELVDADEPSRFGTRPNDSGLDWVEVEPATDLETLARALQAVGDFVDRETAAALGLPWRLDQVDMTSLPTYGGKEPADTTMVWSWDETRLLVGDSLPFLIVPRDEDDDLDERIEALRDEAGQAGDLAQVALCNRALEGDQDARVECARVIDNAGASNDD